MKKIVIAPDSFKESLSAKQVAKIIASGFHAVFPDVKTVCIPLADGGEGTIDALNDALCGQKIDHRVKDPLMRDHLCYYGWVEEQKLAVIEMAQASGLPLLSKEERDPKITDSFGTGQLIAAALDQGAKEIIIGIGGSATNDGGAGMMRALGVKFLDAQNQPIKEGGAALNNLCYMDCSDIHPRLKDTYFRIVCDVDNPLCGEKGASTVFGPQKGATDADIILLDQALQNYHQILCETLKKDVASIAGAGAAGGMGAAFLAFFPSLELKQGIDIVADIVQLSKHMQDADLAITGEGRMDFQTLFGKTPMGVVRAASAYNIPVIAINGSLGADYDKLLDNGFTAVFDTVIAPTSLEDALKMTEKNLFSMAKSIAQMYKTK